MDIGQTNCPVHTTRSSVFGIHQTPTSTVQWGRCCCKCGISGTRHTPRTLSEDKKHDREMENIFYILIPAQRRVFLRLSLTWKDVPQPVVSISQSKKIPGSSDHMQQWCRNSNDLHSFTTMKKALPMGWNPRAQASLKDVPWIIHDRNTIEK